jgi:folate-binding protein YgfZ
MRLLDEGRAVVVRSSYRLVRVGGEDARRWLDDLVTASVESLARGCSRRSLLLSPTGHIRADFQILCTSDAFVLVQDPRQPRPVDELLAPYILSSDVRLAPVADRVLLCAPGDGAAAPEDIVRWDSYVPSMLDGGFDGLVAGDAVSDALAALAPRRPVSEEAARAWMIRRGIASFGVDLDERSLPAEGGLDETTVDFAKGCFLGQESVAKLRNLGHPPRLVLALVAGAPVRPGEAVRADGAEVGVVTSAVRLDDERATHVLARVRWDARELPLVTPGGVPLARP